jgi:uncharacterized membrane protein YphA (DoxX/SURF4 family)
MTFGQRFALNVAPLLLRLGLAFTFIYYGAGKLFYADMPVQGEDAAYLANAGLIKAPPRPTYPAPEEKTAPASDSAKDTGKAVFLDRPALTGAVIIPAQNTEKPAGEKPSADKPAEKPAETTPKAEPPPATPAAEKPQAPAEKKAEAAPPAPRYSASDFTEPIKVRRLMGLVVGMHHASEEGHWPKQLSSPTALRVLAWVASLTEFLGGWLILLGFLTRIWALGFVATMCVAMWLTQIAPNIGVDHALLGFLPPLQIADAENWGSWQTWHFQAMILLSSLAVVHPGPGKISLDAMLFRRPDRGATPAPPQDHA